MRKMQKVAMILSSMVDLRVRGGIVPAHEGRLDAAAYFNLDGLSDLATPSRRFRSCAC
jgi:hypothetical protein